MQEQELNKNVIIILTNHFETYIILTTHIGVTHSYANIKNRERKSSSSLNRVVLRHNRCSCYEQRTMSANIN